GALARQLVLEIARAVAVVAGDAVVHALERETGLLLVIELRVLPGAGDVALGALDTPVAVVHVVRLVARDAFFGRIFITVAEVTGRAGRLTVLVPQWKRGLIVIVACGAPRSRRDTSGSHAPDCARGAPLCAVSPCTPCA